MSRETYVLRDGKLVPKHMAAPKSGAAFFVISDEMKPMRHPITNKLMDSKSQFRAVTRAHGCVEVGNDVQRDTRRMDMNPIKADIAQAISELGG